MTCVVCGGSGWVNLPLMRKISCVYEDYSSSISKCEETSRTYHCPECRGEQTSREKTKVLYAEMPLYGDVPAHYAEKPLASALVDAAINAGLIEFKEEKNGPEQRTAIAKIGIVGARTVNGMEELAAERWDRMSGKVADIAIEKISMWGSQLDWDMIKKSDAKRFVLEALREVKEAEG